MKNSEDDIRLFRLIIITLLAVAISIMILLPANAVSSKEGSDKKAQNEEQINEDKSKKKRVDESTESLLSYLSYCESRDRQFNPDGSVLRGTVNSKDVGKWQINEDHWLEKSQELGYDIYTEEGNRLMALHILEVQGIGAWSASSECLAKEFGFLID